MDFIINLDTGIFLFFNSMHCTFADHFMQLASERMIWLPMYIVLLAVIIRNYGWRKGLLILVAAIAAIAAADQLCATIIRPMVQRMRPANPAHELSLLVHIVDGYRGGMYGFPSCHAANTFALVGMMAPLIANRRFTAALIAWALLNCYSRIHLGVHYPGDLLVGASIGFAIGYVCYRTIKVIIPVGTSIPVLSLRSLSVLLTDMVVITVATTMIIIAFASI